MAKGGTIEKWPSGIPHASLTLSYPYSSTILLSSIFNLTTFTHFFIPFLNQKLHIHLLSIIPNHHSRDHFTSWNSRLNHFSSNHHLSYSSSHTHLPTPLFHNIKSIKHSTHNSPYIISQNHPLKPPQTSNTHTINTTTTTQCSLFLRNLNSIILFQTTHIITIATYTIHLHMRHTLLQTIFLAFGGTVAQSNETHENSRAQIRMCFHRRDSSSYSTS